MSDDVRLVVMRLIDMHRFHPQQDNSKVCSECGARVGIYPSGFKVMRENPGAIILCMHCALAGGEPDEIKPAGTWKEIIAESRASKDVGKA